MNKILFVILILFYFDATNGINHRINEGASTSREPSERELDNCVRCDLQNRALNLVLLMTAEDSANENLTYMMNNRFSELEAFYTEVNHIILDVEFQGSNTSAEEGIRRLNYFTEMTDQKLLELFQKACTDHYYYHSFCEYNRQMNRVFLRETIDYNTNCLCRNSWEEQPVLNAPFSLPVAKKPEKKYALLFFKNEDRLTAEEISIHHVIPLELITRFFQVWLSDDSDSHLRNIFNGCVLKLFGRLKRSMQKILLVSIRKSGIFSHQPESLNNDNLSFASDDTLLLESIKKAVSWLCGNIFIGPTNRGPFDPAFERSGDQLLEAFDYGAEPIVGQRRFQLLLESFYQMLDYVYQAPRMNPFWRLIYGFNIFTVMALSFHTDIVGITEMDSENWVEVLVTEEVLRRIKSESTRREMANKKYWDIKQNPQRFQRSINDDYYYSKYEKESSLTEVELKNFWREFVSELMKVSLKALSNDQSSLVWSCNFTQLYNDYLSRESISKDDCSACVSLDEFLYSKIPNSKDWYRCNNNEAIVSTIEWCVAWKNIMMSLKAKTIDSANSTNSLHNNRLVTQNRFDIFKLQKNGKDIEILVNWLSSGKKIKITEEFQFHLRTLLKNPLKEKKRAGSVLDIILCKLLAIMPVSRTWNFQWSDCIKSFQLIDPFFANLRNSEKIFGYIF